MKVRSQVVEVWKLRVELSGIQKVEGIITRQSFHGTKMDVASHGPRNERRDKRSPGARCKSVRECEAMDQEDSWSN